MLLSIITVNLNNQKGLQKTFYSVFQQSNKAFEYLVIDGGSDDGSQQLITDNQDKISYWRSETDTGIYAAMNKGIASASGKYLLFLNSGDTLHHPNTIAQLLTQIVDADIYYSDAFCVYTSINKGYLKHYPAKIDARYLLSNALNHQNTLVKRSLLLASGGYDEQYRLLADRDFIFAAFLKNASFAYLSKTIISNYCLEGRSSAHKKTEEEWFEIVKTKYPASIKPYEKLQASRQHFNQRLTHKIKRTLLKLKLQRLPNNFKIH